jgi:hypothetical protein
MWHQHQKFVVSQFWRLKVQNQGAGRAWWYIIVIPALRRQRPEDCLSWRVWGHLGQHSEALCQNKASAIKVSAGLVPSEACPTSHLASDDLLPVFGILWDVRHCCEPCLCLYLVFSMCGYAHMCVCIQTSPLYKDISHNGIEATLLQYDFILSNHICGHPISK